MKSTILVAITVMTMAVLPAQAIAEETGKSLASSLEDFVKEVKNSPTVKAMTKDVDHFMADTEMQLKFQLCKDKLPKPQKEKLQEAQDAWIQYRDACAAFASSYMGAKGRASVKELKSEMTEKHIEVLEALLTELSHQGS